MLGLVDAVGLVFFTEAQADGELQDVRQDSRNDERVGKNRERAYRLAPELIEATAVEQTRDGGGRLGGRQEANQQGAGQTTDHVDSDDVEGVVVAELELQSDGQCTDGPTEESDDDCAEHV